MVKNTKKDLQIDELAKDLQRVRADFENYRKRVESEKNTAREYGQKEMIMKVLPIIDDIERAIINTPEEISEQAWVKGIGTLGKNLDKALSNIGIKKIIAQPGTAFSPDLHHAVQFDEESSGDSEVVAEELQAGYMLGNKVLRESMVKVRRK